MTKLLLVNCLLHLNEGQKCFGRTCILIFSFKRLVTILFLFLVTVLFHILAFKINYRNNTYPLAYIQAIKHLYRKKNDSCIPASDPIPLYNHCWVYCIPFMTFLCLLNILDVYTHTHIHHSYTCMLFLKNVLNPLSSTHQWALKTLEPFVSWLAAS